MPRPFLVPAAVAMGPKIARAAGRAAHSLMMGHGLLGAEVHELAELAHLIGEAAHSVHENLVEPLFEHEEHESERRR